MESCESIINKRFIVKFQSSNPDNCILLPDIRVANSVKIPILAWDSIPVEEDKRCILDNK